MTDRRRDRLESRRYSNLMDLPGVERSRDTSTSSRTNLWVEDEFSYQERRFVNDFKPFFLLCQLSGMFPNKLDWKLSFSWGYWATYFCLFYLFIMIVLLVFYISQVIMVVSEEAGLLYISYNLAWCVHVAHCVDFIFLFYEDKKHFAQIFQGYRKFYRSDKSVIRFTWKTFVTWEIMFYITAAILILKSYYDRFLNESSVEEQVITDKDKELCTDLGYEMREKSNRTILATIDQLPFVKNSFDQTTLDLIFWINLIANVMCVNIVFLSEVFFMVMVSIIYHAFAFIHKQIDKLLGNPDSIFNINVVHEPDTIDVDHRDPKKKILNSEGARWLKQAQGQDFSVSVSISPKQRLNYRNQEASITIRALWEQMEELIDLLEQLNHVFGMTLQFLSLEYLLLFPAMLYFSIELFPSLSAVSIVAFLSSFFILGFRSFIFTFVCARVNKEAVAPIGTLYRAYVKGDVSSHDYELISMFITRLSTTTIAVRTWSHVSITRQTFSIIFVTVFGILAVLLQSGHTNL